MNEFERRQKRLREQQVQLASDWIAFWVHEIGAELIFQRGGAFWYRAAGTGDWTRIGDQGARYTLDRTTAYADNHGFLRRDMCLAPGCVKHQDLFAEYCTEHR